MSLAGAPQDSSGCGYCPRERKPGPVEDFELPVRGERHQQPLGPQGVGKTTTASAVALADAGERTLIIKH